MFEWDREIWTGMKNEENYRADLSNTIKKEKLHQYAH